MPTLLIERILESDAAQLRKFASTYSAAKKSDKIEDRRQTLKSIAEIAAYCNNRKLIADIICVGCPAAVVLADAVADKYASATVVAAPKEKTSAADKATKE